MNITSFKNPQWLFIPSLLSLFFLISFCSNEKTKRSVNDFHFWVKEHKDSAGKYMDKEWTDIEKEFTEKKNALDQQLNQFDREMQMVYHQTLEDWESFKREYLIHKSKKEQKQRMDRLICVSTDKGIESDVKNLTPSNISDVYEQFVSTVNDNRDLYTREEWTIIEDRWDKLNDKESRMVKEHAISREDRRKITGLQIKYVTIKALNRPFAEQK